MVRLLRRPRPQIPPPRPILEVHWCQRGRQRAPPKARSVVTIGGPLAAAAPSITVQIPSPLAATLLGAMFFSFVLLIDIPGLLAHPSNRLFWTLTLREIAFSGGAFAYAGSPGRSGRTSGVPGLVTVARFFVAIPAVFYCVEHFLHPGFAPGA